MTFLFSERPACPVFCPEGTGASFPEEKRLGREADQSSPSDPEVKNAWSYIFSFPYIFLALSLITLRDNLSSPSVADVDKTARTFESKSITFNILALKLAETETFIVQCGK
jgi:hypothetical protein